MINVDLRPVNSTSYLAGPTVRMFAAGKLAERINKKVMKPVGTEREAPIVFVPEKRGPLAFV